VGGGGVLIRRCTVSVRPLKQINFVIVYVYTNTEKKLCQHINKQTSEKKKNNLVLVKYQSTAVFIVETKIKTLKVKTEHELSRNPALRGLTVGHSRTSLYGRLHVAESSFSPRESRSHVTSNSIIRKPS